MEEPQSPVSTLFGDLRERGFDASLAHADGTLHVRAKNLSREQIESLAAVVDRHGAHFNIDQRGVLTIWVDREGPNFAEPS
jgi:hypothetical protein